MLAARWRCLSVLLRLEIAAIVGFLGSLADDRNLQTATDYRCNLLKRYSFICNRVISESRCTVFASEPVHKGSVQPVHAGPAVEPVSHIRRDTLFTSDTDEDWNEAVMAIAVDRCRKAYDRCAHATLHQRLSRRFRGARIRGRHRRSGMLLCSDAASSICRMLYSIGLC